MNNKNIVRKIVSLIICLSVFLSVTSFIGCNKKDGAVTLEGIKVQVEPSRFLKVRGNS